LPKTKLETVFFIKKGPRMFILNETVKYWVISALLFLTACATTESNFRLEPIAFSELPHWSSDSISEAWLPFQRSCTQMKKLPANTVFLNNQTLSQWQSVCSAALQYKTASEENIRLFFETNFVPHRVSSLGNKTGLFTGYYEPKVKGSLKRTPHYNVAIYKRPLDLVMAENLFVLRPDKPELKGVRIAGRVEKGALRPYATRAQIEKSTLLQGAEALWLSSAVEAYFIHVQGSAAVELPSGQTVRLGYDGTNGHPYTSLGKVLIDRKQLSREAVSMQSIVQWLLKHPQEAAALMQENDSFVFFKLQQQQGPVGAQGVVLTPGRSLAVDPAFVAFGTPVWLVASPVTAQSSPVRRLLIAQDKGGAIKGPIRGDVFWGTGDTAGAMAGMMKSSGHYYLLLPKKEMP
jgi:membrane-bound lytic murein transglycosylase A